MQTLCLKTERRLTTPNDTNQVRCNNENGVLIKTRNCKEKTWKKQYAQPGMWILHKNAYARYYREALIHLVQTNKQKSGWKNKKRQKLLN